MNVCVWIYHLTCEPLTQTHTHTHTRMDARTPTVALLNHWVGRRTVPAHTYIYIHIHIYVHISHAGFMTQPTAQQRRSYGNSHYDNGAGNDARCRIAALLFSRAHVRRYARRTPVLFGMNVCDNNNNSHFARTHVRTHSRV